MSAPLTENEQKILQYLLDKHYDPLKIEPLIETLRRVVRDLIAAGVQQGNGQNAAGGRLLGLNRTTFRYMRENIDKMVSFSHPRKGKPKCS